MPDSSVLLPTAQQIDRLRAGSRHARVALVQLLDVRERGLLQRYVALTGRAVARARGRRVYGGSLTRLPGSDPVMRFDALVIDELPSGDAAAAYVGDAKAEREAAVRSQFVLAMRPAPRLPFLLLRAAGRVASLVSREIAEAPPPPQGLSDETGGFAALLTGDDERDSLAVFNLNQYRERANDPRGDGEATDRSGRDAYRRYGRTALPMILRRAGFPLWGGRPLYSVVGGADDPLTGAWDEFVLVFYPSRLAIRDMLNDPRYQERFADRTAGLERAAVLVGTPWPGFDPRR